MGQAAPSYHITASWLVEMRNVPGGKLRGHWALVTMAGESCLVWGRRDLHGRCRI